MKLTVEISEVKETKSPVTDNPTLWELSFTIVGDSGEQLYVPTTVYSYQFGPEVKSVNNADIVEFAAKEVLPQQIAMLMGKYRVSPQLHQHDYFDTLAHTMSEKEEEAKENASTDRNTESDHEHNTGTI